MTAVTSKRKKKFISQTFFLECNNEKRRQKIKVYRELSLDENGLV